MDEDRASQPTTIGRELLLKWRGMQPIEQGRPWRWGIQDMAALKRSLYALQDQLEEQLAPAGTASVRRAFEMLSDAYASRAAGDNSKRIALWLDTFGNWPRCALDAAVSAWATKDTAYMPSPGQFHACGVPAIEARRAELQDVRQILRAIDKPEDKDWDSFVPDPEVARKLKRLMTGLRNGEDLRALRARGEI